jgi:pSer/pThr/pTyr-binding forkhead associated (FHA) protein
MPITLLVISAANDGEAPALTFDGNRIVIGRGDSCEVRLPDPSVSHRHASVRVKGSAYAIVDEGSTNGTFVGGVRLSPNTPRAIRNGDMIRVGRVWIEARLGTAAPTHDLKAKTRDLAMALVANAMDAQGDDVVPAVEIVEGRDLGAKLRLEDEGRAYVIGRSETCDLPLAEPDASREHLQLTRRGSTVLVQDLGSKNGALLGEVRITPGRDVAWRAPAMIRVGSTVIALDEPVADALLSLEEAADEPFHDSDIAPPPGSMAPPKSDRPSEASLPSDKAIAIESHASSPIVAVEPVAPIAATKRRRSGWSPTDIAIVIAAIALIVVSLAGLVWLLRG